MERTGGEGRRRERRGREQRGVAATTEPTNRPSEPTSSGKRAGSCCQGLGVWCPMGRVPSYHIEL